MSIAKRVTYLKGLAEGLGLGNETKEEKVLQVMIEILEDISTEMEELAEDVASLDDDVSVLVEDMQDMEDMLFEGDDEDEPHAHSHAGGNGCCDRTVKNGKNGKQQFYAVTCPSCQSEINIDEDVLKRGKIDCPSCKEHLELDLEDPL